MKIMIGKNGSQIGPFDEATVRSMLQNGMASHLDLYWIEGNPSWEPLARLFPDLEVVHPAPATQVPPVSKFHQSATKSLISTHSLTAVGYLSALLAMVLLPPVFSLAGIALGITTMNRGNSKHGFAIIAASLASGIHGWFHGALMGF